VAVTEAEWLACTESEWLACTEPQPMLDFLRGKASDRKLRLFACACCRRIPGYLESEPDHRGLELTESDVDGLAADEDFASLPYGVWDIRWYTRAGWDAIYRAMHAYFSEVWVSQNLHAATEQVKAQARRQSHAELAVLLCELFGNPFRPATLNLAWQTAQVVALAQAAYDERELPSGTLDPVRLAVLADALEEAGCTDKTILDHLRGPGPHVRGCWVIDLLLGKE
jgi:hypothetical protein